MEGPASRLDIRILGTLSVRAAGAEVELGSIKQRRLLALLLMRANRAITVSELIDAIWTENPPRTARKNLQVYVCGLRKVMGDRIRYGPNGYVFSSDSGELDLLRFDEFTAAGRRAVRNGDTTAAADLLGSAVRLWRGRAAAGLWDAGEIPGDAGRLWDHFATAYEDWIDATISIGRHIEALENLDAMEEAFIHRERLTISRMRALTLCGRTLEALASYEAKRQFLAREYGIDPSPVLQTMYHSLLSPESYGAPVMFANTPPRPVPVAPYQLPRQIPDQVERTEPLRQLLEHPAGIKVVWGRLGTGKTALAVQAARLMAEDFPDGTLFVRSSAADGQQKNGAAVVRELLSAVGLSAGVPDDPEAAGALWRSWTTSRKILLVLDDVPEEDYAEAVLPSSPDSLVIITSRSRLSGLEADQWIELADFTEWEASQLLARLIGERRVDREPQAVAKIIARCGSSPLAMRVIGSKLSAIPHLSVADFAARLAGDDPFAELVSGQVSVEARYAKWYQDLPEESRAAARCLAEMSAEPFTQIEACQALAFEGHSPDRAFELLLERGMLSASEAFDEVTAHAVADVTVHAEMYEMPPLIRRFLLRGADEA